MPEPAPVSPGNLKEQERIDAFNQSSFARLLNMTITEAHDGYARVVMACGQALNPHAVMHGGAIFAIADQAFGIAANCGSAERVAVSVHIQYIAPATGTLEAVAHKVADNGRYSTFRVMVYEGSRTIAEFDGVALQVNPPV